MRKLIRTDGSSMDLPSSMSMADLKKLMGAETIDTVSLRHLGSPLIVMLVDDNGYETKMVDHGGGHFESKPVRALKPVNEEATKLYLRNCRPGATHKIVGDVVIVPDQDFE